MNTSRSKTAILSKTENPWMVLTSPLGALLVSSAISSHYTLAYFSFCFYTSVMNHLTDLREADAEFSQLSKSFYWAPLGCNSLSSFNFDVIYSVNYLCLQNYLKEEKASLQLQQFQNTCACKYHPVFCFSLSFCVLSFLFEITLLLFNSGS